MKLLQNKTTQGDFISSRGCETQEAVVIMIPQVDKNVKHLGKYKVHKKQAQKLADVYAYLKENCGSPVLMDKYEKKEDRVRYCGSTLMMDKYEKDGQEKWMLVGANFCRVMLCPMCQWRRAVKLYSDFLRLFEFVHQSWPKDVPKERYLLLTLTVPNVSGSQLRDKILEMSAAWERLTYNGFPEWKAVKGYYRCLEVSHNVTAHTYHPHFHVVLLVDEDYFQREKGRYVTQERWQELWRLCMNDMRISSTDIRPLRGRTTKAVLKSLNEVCKYTTKPTEFLTGAIAYQAETVGTIDSALHKIRRASFGGWLKKARAELRLGDDITRDDKIQVDGWRKVDSVWYHWASGIGEYTVL